MQQKSSAKSVLVLVAVLIVIGGIYFYMSGTPADTSQVTEETGGDAGAGDVGADVLVLLNQIKKLTIDKSFFASPVFTSLVDHTVPIYPQNVGKPNPFYNAKPKSNTPSR